MDLKRNKDLFIHLIFLLIYLIMNPHAAYIDLMQFVLVIFFNCTDVINKWLIIYTQAYKTPEYKLVFARGVSQFLVIILCSIAGFKKEIYLQGWYLCFGCNFLWVFLSIQHWNGKITNSEVCKKLVIPWTLHKRATRRGKHSTRVFVCIFRHLKLELLTQFPASNDEEYFHLWEICVSESELFD